MSTLVTRRVFMQSAVGTLATFVLPLRLAAAADEGKTFAPNAFVAIDNDGSVTLTVQRSEMGQGIRTALAMILCDELDADWHRVRVVQAPGDARYGDQDTVGDYSLIVSWDPLRKAAASAREMLVRAASRALDTAPEKLRTESGKVIAPDGRALDYGALAKVAALEAVPENPKLKNASQYRLIGRPTPSVDLPALTTGATIYGLDVRAPGMQYAMIEHAPLPKARMRSVDDAASRAVPGVSAVFAIEGKFVASGATSSGVAIVARDSWTCLKARRASMSGAAACPCACLRSSNVEIRRARASRRRQARPSSNCSRPDSPPKDPGSNARSDVARR